VAICLLCDLAYAAAARAAASRQTGVETVAYARMRDVYGARVRPLQLRNRRSPAWRMPGPQVAVPGRRHLIRKNAQAAVLLVKSGMSPTRAARQIRLGRSTLYWEIQGQSLA
jgi:hypothetical protein